MRSSRPAVLAHLALFVAFGIARSLGQSSTDDPSINRPVSQAELDKLKLEIEDDSQSSLEAIGVYHNESGDLNNRLDFWRYGGRLNFRLSSAASVFVSGTRTQYMTLASIFSGAGTNFSAGYKGQISERTQLQLEGGATHFNTASTTINALAGLNFKPSDQTTIYLTGTRSNVEESLLSATGLRPVVGPFAGHLVGLVMDNRVTGGISQKLPHSFDAFAEGGFGNRTGSSIESNFFRDARAGLGYDVVTNSADENGVTLVRASYQLNYFGFDKNLFGYGGASLLTAGGRPIAPAALGGDNISPSGTFAQGAVGGYFSPQYFVSHVGRFDLQGNTDSGLRYSISAFAGSQSYTGSDARAVGGVSATVEVPFGEKLSLPITYARDNFGPFTQQYVLGRLVIKF